MVVDGSKGIKSYRRFLEDLWLDVRVAMAECEDAEMHHSESGSVLWIHYNRICGWCDEIEDRVEWYNAKTKCGRASVPGGPMPL